MSEQANNPTNSHSLTCKDVKQEQQKNSKLGFMALLLLQTVKDDGEAGQWLVTAHPEQNDEFHKYKLLSTVMAITISPPPPPPFRLPVPRLFPREREYNGSLTHRWVFGEERQGQSVYVSTPVAER
jgi:hypothetical protein